MNYYTSKLLLAVAFATLVGCGQTGPLYMPPEENPPKPPAMAEPSAAPVAEQPQKQS